MRQILPATLAVPCIETPRLRLRGHTAADFNCFCSLWSDPEVTRYIGGKPFSQHESWMRFLRYFGHWSVLGFGTWAVEEAATGELIGEVGLFDYKRDIDPPLGDAREAGWALSSRKQGRGYATEAVQAMLAWAAEHLGPVNLACVVHPEHRASIRVARKCGFEQCQATTYQGTPVLIFRRTL